MTNQTPYHRFTKEQVQHALDCTNVIEPLTERPFSIDEAKKLIRSAAPSKKNGQKHWDVSIWESAIGLNPTVLSEAEASFWTRVFLWSEGADSSSCEYLEKYLDNDGQQGIITIAQVTTALEQDILVKRVHFINEHVVVCLRRLFGLRKTLELAVDPRNSWTTVELAAVFEKLPALSDNSHVEKKDVESLVDELQKCLDRSDWLQCSYFMRLCAWAKNKQWGTWIIEHYVDRSSDTYGDTAAFLQLSFVVEDPGLYAQRVEAFPHAWTIDVLIRMIVSSYDSVAKLAELSLFDGKLQRRAEAMNMLTRVHCASLAPIFLDISLAKKGSNLFGLADAAEKWLRYDLAMTIDGLLPLLLTKSKKGQNAKNWLANQSGAVFEKALSEAIANFSQVQQKKIREQIGDPRHAEGKPGKPGILVSSPTQGAENTIDGKDEQWPLWAQQDAKIPSFLTKSALPSLKTKSGKVLPPHVVASFLMQLKNEPVDSNVRYRPISESLQSIAQMIEPTSGSLFGAYCIEALFSSKNVGEWRALLYLIRLFAGPEVLWVTDNKLRSKVYPRSEDASLCTLAIQMIGALKTTEARRVLEDILLSNCNAHNSLEVRDTLETVFGESERTQNVIFQDLPWYGIENRSVEEAGPNRMPSARINVGSQCVHLCVSEEASLLVFDNQWRKIRSVPVIQKEEDSGSGSMSRLYSKMISARLKEKLGALKAGLAVAMVDGVSFEITEWQERFLVHPLLRPFSYGLIWGLFDDRGVLFSTFRRNGNELVNEKDETVLLPKNRKIKLVDPTDLSEDKLKMWRQHLADYQIIQPVMQIDRPIVKQTIEQWAEQHLPLRVNTKKLLVQLVTNGEWSLGRTGIYYTKFFRYFEHSAVGVVLDFSPSFFNSSASDSREITLKSLHLSTLTATQVAVSPSYHLSQEIRAELQKAIEQNQWPQVSNDRVRSLILFELEQALLVAKG